MELSARARQRLAQLRESYRLSLGDKAVAIRQAADVARQGDYRPEALAGLRHHVHKLAGSAGTYEFDDLYRQADALERCVKALQEDPALAEGAARSGQIERLQAETGRLLDLLQRTAAAQSTP